MSINQIVKKNRIMWMVILVLTAAMGFGCAHRKAVETVGTPASESMDLAEASEPATERPVGDPSGDERDLEFEDDLDVFDEFDEPAPVRVADPLEPWNRAMYHVNDKLYFWVLKPVASGYKTVAPEPVRLGIRNFFHNIAMPIRLVNCLLQGKVTYAGTELGRFLINSTAGVLGFADPARHTPGWVPREEDFGQTLAVYGIGDGLYIVWPFYGPSTARDTVGGLGDRFLNPVNYIVDSPEVSYGITAVETINNTSFRIGDYEALKDAALEPYHAIRDAYIQYRRKKIDE